MAEPRDLWWEARQRTAAQKPSLLVQLNGMVQSLRGQPTRPVYAMNPLIREGCAIVADLNKYRKDLNLSEMQKRGVNRFKLRIGGPKAWVADRWDWTEDESYRPYMDQLAPMDLTDKTVGYIVHCSGATRESPDKNLDHVRLLDQWTSGGYMPAAFDYDDEVYEWWSGGGLVKNTPNNHVNSLAWNTEQTWQKFHRVTGIYTARWFINKYPGLLDRYQIFLDQINGTSEGMRRPMWYAWVPIVFSSTFNNAGEMVAKLPTPTSDQISKLLQCGSYSAYVLWQCTFTFKLPGMTTGVDCSVSRGSLYDYDWSYNMASATPPPPPPPVGELDWDTLRADGHANWDAFIETEKAKV